MDTWENWGKSIHKDPEQIKRKTRAKEINCTPIFINKNNFSGEFRGSKNQIYTTNLNECSCMDFFRRNLPCKHMYRLAHELNLYDLSKVETGITKSEAIEILESLPNDSAKILKDILRHYIYPSSKKQFMTYNNEFIKILLDSEIVIDSNDIYLKLDSKTKNHLYELLNNEDKKTIKKNIRKSDLIKWIINNKNNLVEYMNSIIKCLSISHKFDTYKRVFYMRLCKRFNHDDELYHNKALNFPGNIILTNIRPTVDTINTSSNFYNKIVVFTGELKTLTKLEAMQKVVNLGGILKQRVSRKTDYLILGISADTSSYTYFDENLEICTDICEMSKKESDARNLIANGYDIKILNENQFLDMLNEEK